MLFDQIQFKQLLYSNRNVVIQFNRLFNSIVRESLTLVESDKCPKIAGNRQKIGLLKQKFKISSVYESFTLDLPTFNSTKV